MFLYHLEKYKVCFHKWNTFFTISKALKFVVRWLADCGTVRDCLSSRLQREIATPEYKLYRQVIAFSTVWSVLYIVFSRCQSTPLYQSIIPALPITWPPPDRRCNGPNTVANCFSGGDRHGSLNPALPKHFSRVWRFSKLNPNSPKINLIHQTGFQLAFLNPALPNTIACYCSAAGR